MSGAKNHESLNRFCQAAECAKSFQSSSLTGDRDYALDILKRVSNQGTMWSIVYDIKGRRIYFQTRQNADLRWLSLDDLDFAASVSPVYTDVNAPVQGDVAAHVQALTHAVNEEYLLKLSRREDVKERLGDLTPILKALLMLTRTYQPTE